MKFLSPLLAIVVLWLSLAPQNEEYCPKTTATAKTSCSSAKRKPSCGSASHCTQRQTKPPQQAATTTANKRLNDCCPSGGCNPFQACSYCCFMPTEGFCLPSPAISITQKEKVRLGYIISVSHFSGDFFQPPEWMI